MRISEDRFSKSSTQFLGVDGKIRPAMQYTYESHNAIYDIVVIEGLKFARKNMGPLSNLINAWTPHHYEIEHHFDLNA